MGFYNFSEIQILVFALVLIRISAFIVAFPLVEGGQIPASIKILLSLALTLIIAPVTSYQGLDLEFITNNLFLLAMKEAFVGLFIGFIAKFFFHALAICGEIVTVSIGLSSGQLFDPAMGRRVTIIESFDLLLGALFFLAFNGHHIFLGGLVDSFNFIPLAKTALHLEIFRDITLVAEQVIVLGIKLSAPVMGAIFLTNMAMGIIGRAVPQINVLITSWPLNILMGLVILIVSLPLFMLSLGGALNWNIDTLFDILKRI